MAFRVDKAAKQTDCNRVDIKIHTNKNLQLELETRYAPTPYSVVELMIRNSLEFIECSNECLSEVLAHNY